MSIKHRLGLRQTAVELQDGNYASQHIEAGGTAIATGQVTSTATASELVPENTNRKALHIHAVAAVHVGGSDVTASTGFKIPAGGTITLHVSSAVHVIGAGTVTWLEELI